MNTAHAESRKESDRIRAARGFASFPEWGKLNRKAAANHRRNDKADLADALDREYDRYVSRNL